MKFVRWLGAFGSGSSLSEAAEWELSQTARQVAVEPLYRGRSLLRHCKIGLVVDHNASRFHAGWLVDAYTKQVGDTGILRPLYSPASRQGKKYRDVDRFLEAWSATRNQSGHGEVIFDSPIYSAVAVKSTATEHGKRRAERLAKRLNLPLKEMKDY
jgi:hypothetical protein